MKNVIKIIIAIVAVMGITGAMNYLPESTLEPGADLSMFEGDPGNVEMWSGSLNNATYDWPALMGIVVYPIGDWYHTKNAYGGSLYSGTDASAAIQAGVDYSYNSGGRSRGKVNLFPGNYTITSQIDQWNGVHIDGLINPCTEDISGSKNLTVLSVMFNTAGAIEYRSGATIENVVIYYPDQVDSPPPVWYPATFEAKTGNCLQYTMKNVLAINPYILINSTQTHNTLMLENVYGYPIYRGIVEDNGLDASVWNNVHFWPDYWYDRNRTVGYNMVEWSKVNGIGFDVNRSDSSKLTDCFAFGYAYGYYLGPASGNIRVTNSDADECHVGIFSSGHDTVIIGGYYVGDNHYSDSIGVYLNGAANPIVQNCRVVAPYIDVYLYNCANPTITGCSIGGFSNVSSPSWRGIYLDLFYGNGGIISGNTISGANTVLATEYGIDVQDCVGSLAIFGNYLESIASYSIYIHGGAATDYYSIVANIGRATGGINDAIGGANAVVANNVDD
jgi:hypothetical protein